MASRGATILQTKRMRQSFVQRLDKKSGCYVNSNTIVGSRVLLHATADYSRVARVNKPPTFMQDE